MLKQLPRVWIVWLRQEILKIKLGRTLSLIDVTVSPFLDP